MSVALRARIPDIEILARAAEWLATAVAVSLPWSTTATSILIVLWLIAVLPTLDAAAVKRELLTPAGGLPIALWGLATLGLFWSDASWGERLAGYSSFHRFLIIPLLLAEFRRSEHGMRVLVGFFASVTAVLLVSCLLLLFPRLPWHSSEYGVPVKDYILQSEEFVICAFVLLSLAIDEDRAGRYRRVIGALVLAFLFLADIAFVATGRTALLIAPALAFLLGWREFRWKGLLGAAMVLGILGGAAAVEAPYLRARLNTSLSELHVYELSNGVNSTSIHLELLKRSAAIMRTAPIIGHGTGSIAKQFRNAAAGKSGVSAVVGVNPHDQIFNVGIQLGLAGVAVLIAMWVAHFMLFRGSGLLVWIGIVIVTQNVVSSLVNSHLFDFTQAWLYIFGVGVTGGIALRERDRTAAAHRAKRYENCQTTA